MTMNIYECNKMPLRALKHLLLSFSSQESDESRLQSYFAPCWYVGHAVPNHLAPSVLRPLRKAVMPTPHMASALPIAAICPITFSVFLIIETEWEGKREHLVVRKTTHATHMSVDHLCMKWDENVTKLIRVNLWEIIFDTIWQKVEIFSVILFCDPELALYQWRNLSYSM